jgi:hypothetical protein
VREELGGGAGLSVLSLWLVLRQIQVHLKLVFEISLVIYFCFKFTLSILLYLVYGSLSVLFLFQRE